MVSSRNTASMTWTTVTRTAFVNIPTSQLTVTRTGTGTGAITATPTPPGLSCPGGTNTLAVPCPTATFATGTSVLLTAVPDAGSTFAGWTGGCSGTGQCGVPMNGDRYATAIFAKTPGTLDVAYYHTDVIGSVRAITDDAGAVVIRHDNAPFGEDTVDPTSNPFRFAGKELDPETWLHYFAARYYRNTWGRFTSVDPLTGSPFDPQTLNRYAYALNNPLRYVDPTGLRACAWVDGILVCDPYEYCSNGAINPPRCTLTELVLGLIGSRNSEGKVTSLDDMILDFPGRRGGPGPNTGQGCGRPNGCPAPVDGGGYQVPSAPKLEIPLGDWIQAGAFGASLVNPVAGLALGAMSAAFWDDWMDSLAMLPGPGKAAKALASEAGMAQLVRGGGKAIAGRGASSPIRDIDRLVRTYGGETGDWAKITSTIPGASPQVHAYRNVVTGQVVEMKSKLR